MEISQNTTLQAQTIENSTIEMLASPILTVWMPVIYLLVFIISTPCNIICLWLLFCYTKQKNPTVVFAINLCLTDLLYSLFLPFQVFYYFHGTNWTFGRVMCSVTSISFFCNMNGSILTTCAISLERYLGIVHPFWIRQHKSARNAVFICLLIWASVLSVHVPVLHKDITYRVHQLNVTTCFDILPKGLFPYTTLAYLYFGSLLLFFFILPFVVLIGCYTSIIKKLRSSSHQETMQSRQQTIRLIVVVMLIVASCYLPTIVIQVLHMGVSAKGKSVYVYYKLSLGINSLNGCIDPFIYYFASKEFRTVLHRRCVSFYRG